uniref:Uncharacterized protein n=1 Tax=Timema shepardi TaxID=629360 RepID=A0A7R9G166_TIMSH|nr:unnamed protein product [Timema shepardi]
MQVAGRCCSTIFIVEWAEPESADCQAADYQKNVAVVDSSIRNGKHSQCTQFRREHNKRTQREKSGAGGTSPDREWFAYSYLTFLHENNESLGSRSTSKKGTAVNKGKKKLLVSTFVVVEVLLLEGKHMRLKILPLKLIENFQGLPMNKPISRYHQQQLKRCSTFRPSDYLLLAELALGHRVVLFLFGELEFLIVELTKLEQNCHWFISGFHRWHPATVHHQLGSGCQEPTLFPSGRLLIHLY